MMVPRRGQRRRAELDGPSGPAVTAPLYGIGGARLRAKGPSRRDACRFWRSARPGDQPRGIAAALAHPGVDEAAGDAEGGRHRRQLVERAPVGLRQLAGIDPQLAAGVLGREAEHQRVGKRPWLAAEVTQVGELDADLLADLTAHGVLDRLAR